jgi:Major capsid protein N-terminus
MSSGGMSQLVAVGAQDVFLIGKPEVSFFQSAYKQHTNFSQVVARQVLQGNPTPGGMSSVRFERAGDMMGYVYIAPTCTIGGVSTAYQTQNWSNVINYVEFYIGGQLIDRQDSTFSEFLAPNLLSQGTSKSSLVMNHGGYGTPSYFYP